MLEPRAGSPLARFDDIVIHDGSSFALKASLRGVFPGRFTTVDPAAVELHATLSGFGDEVIEVTGLYRTARTPAAYASWLRRLGHARLASG